MFESRIFIPISIPVSVFDVDAIFVEKRSQLYVEWRSVPVGAWNFLHRMMVLGSDGQFWMKKTVCVQNLRLVSNPRPAF